VLAIVAPQLLGGATPRTELAILVLACLVCAWAAVALYGTRRPLGAVPAAGLAGFVATAWTGLQLVPLPCGWFDSGELRLHALNELAALGALDAPVCAVSWAPGSTRAALAATAVLSAVFLSTVAIARGGQRDVLVRGIALSSVAMALVAVAHTVLKLERVFEWYTPQQAHPPILLAPLLNPNHLAGHLALGFPGCLAVALKTRRVDARIAWLALSFVVLTCGLLTLSRGGVVALWLGGGIYLLAYLRRQRENARGELQYTSQRVLGVLATAVVLVAAASYFAAGRLAREFAEADATEKIVALRNFLPIVKEHPLTGVGRGALVDASARVVPGFVRTPYAEDLPLQWALEWGVPLTIALAALVLASLLSLRLRRNAELALASGLVALGAQNLVDYSLELVGVGCVAAVALGALLSRESPRTSAVARLPQIPLRGACSGAAAVALGAMLLAAEPLSTSSRPELSTSLLRSLGKDAAAFERAQLVAARLYPLDPLLVTIGAAGAVRADAPMAPRWLNLAMEIAPSWAGPHLQAAYFLERKGYLMQSAFETRLAFERNPAEVWATAEGFIKRHPSAVFADEMLPARSEHRQWIAESLATTMFQSASRAQTELFVHHTLELFPSSATANWLNVELALAEGDPQEALERSMRMLERCPDAARGNATVIRSLVHAGNADEALRRYFSLPPALRADREVLLQALQAAGADRNRPAIDQLAEELFARYGGTAGAREGVHWHVSVQLERAGDLAQALSHAQRVYELSNDPVALERVHALAQKIGVVQVALRAATELCHVGHRREVYCQHLSTP
jgi:hypothetical protein